MVGKVRRCCYDSGSPRRGTYNMLGRQLRLVVPDNHDAGGCGRLSSASESWNVTGAVVGR